VNVLKFCISGGVESIIIAAIFLAAMGATVLLIQGALKMNRFLMIYWMVSAAIRIVMFMIMMIYVVSIAPLFFLVLFLSEALEFSKFVVQLFWKVSLKASLQLVGLVIGLFIVMKLYNLMKARDDQSFTVLKEEIVHQVKSNTDYVIQV